MIRFWALVRTNLRELLREKVFLVTAFIAVFLFLLSFLLGALSFSEQKRMIGNFGFLGAFLSAAMMASYIGSYSLFKEIEKQTILLTLSRSVSRGLFLTSKFFGAWLFIGIQVFALCGLVGLLIVDTTTQAGNVLKIAVSIWLQAGYLFAMGMLGAQLVRPPLAFIWSLTAGLISFWLSDLQFFAQKSKVEIFEVLSNLATYVFPRFDKSNWKSFHFVEVGISFESASLMVLHLSFWIAVLLSLAILLFRRRDLV
ncbi:MAG: ABC transporter permease subunit [Bdellovibrionia bacterium]